MDSTSPAPASTVGTTNATAVAGSSAVAFTLELVERLPYAPKAMRAGRDGHAGPGSREQTSAGRGSYPG